MDRTTPDSSGPERQDGPGTGPGPDSPASSGPGTSESGLAPNVAGALTYVLGALTGLLFLVIDGDRAYVRFHAVQSILFGLAWVVGAVALVIVGAILGLVPVVGWLVSLLLSTVAVLGGLGLWIWLMIRAYQGEEWELPLLGPQARRLASGA